MSSGERARSLENREVPRDVVRGHVDGQVPGLGLDADLQPGPIEPKWVVREPRTVETPEHGARAVALQDANGPRGIDPRWGPDEKRGPCDSLFGSGGGVVDVAIDGVNR